MKTLKYVLAVNLLSVLTINLSLAQWVQQNSTTVEFLKDVYCTSADTCYVAGANSTLLKTTDGSATWFLQNSGISGEYLQAVWCINENICFTGEANLYKTIDGGNSWIIKSTPLTTGIASLFFVNDSVGYATGSGGGQIVRTTDAGETWNWSSIIGPVGGAYAVYFTDENIGYAVEYAFPDGRIWKTINGGSNWTQMYVEPNILLMDVFFVNDSTGFVVGDIGTILITTDYGNNWTPQIAGTNNPLKTIHCVDEDTCYVAGTGNIAGSTGTMLKTNDGGNNWAFDTAGVVITSYNTVFFPAPTVGYAVGDGGVIIKTTNGVGIYETNKQVNFSIYPNPFYETATIYISGINPKNTFELYDLTGRKIREMQLNNATTKLERNDLTTGMYLYRLTNDGELLAAGKLMVN